MTEEEKNELLFRFSLKMCTECQAVNLLKKENAELKAICIKLINANNELRNSLQKYEIVPNIDYLPNGLEVYKENVGDNPYGVK